MVFCRTDVSVYKILHHAFPLPERWILEVCVWEALLFACIFTFFGWNPGSPAALPLVSDADECHICSVKVVAEIVSFSVTCASAHPGASHGPPSQDRVSPGPPTAMGWWSPGRWLHLLSGGTHTWGHPDHSRKQQKQPQRDSCGWCPKPGWLWCCLEVGDTLPSPSALGKEPMKGGSNAAESFMHHEPLGKKCQQTTWIWLPWLWTCPAFGWLSFISLSWAVAP